MSNSPKWKISDAVDAARRQASLALKGKVDEKILERVMSAFQSVDNAVERALPRDTNVYPVGDMSAKELELLKALRETIVEQAFPKAVEAAKDLLSFTPDYLEPKMKEMLQEAGSLDDEGTPLQPPWGPFFTECFLYAALGKDNARTLLGRVRSLVESVNLNMDEVVGAVCKDQADKAAQEKTRRERWKAAQEAAKKKPTQAVEGT